MRISEAAIPSLEIWIRNANVQIVISDLEVRNWMFQISISVFEIFPRTFRGNISKLPRSNSAF